MPGGFAGRVGVFGALLAALPWVVGVGPLAPPGLTSRAVAEDMITLGEVLPELAGSPHASAPVLPAPRPGRARTVRRRDIRRVLRQLRVDVKGLSIPRTVRVSRAARQVQAPRLRPLIEEAVQAVVHPCQVASVRTPRRLRVGAGPLSITAEPPRNLRGGRASIALSVEAGGRAQRILVASELDCPEPVIAAGQVVRVVARVGAVLAAAPGRARQPGRVGEIIRVTNTATGASLVGRVVDGDTVEVVR